MKIVPRILLVLLLLTELSSCGYHLVGTTSFLPENIELDEGIFATAEAYRLVTEEGLPFREAYRKVAARYTK